MTIINNSFQFIFVHVPKSAGTSVTSVLSQFTRYCDLEIGGTHFGEQIQPAYGQRFGLAKHSTAAELQSIIGAEKWPTYFSFAFVRNPFLRCLSTFHFLRKWDGLNAEFADKIKSFSSFDEYVLSDMWEKSEGPDRIFRPQAYWLRASPQSTEMLVNFIGHVESIDEDITHILETVGLHEEGIQLSSVPKLNQSQESVPNIYWDERVVDKIIKKYKVDFNCFGYSLDPQIIFSV